MDLSTGNAKLWAAGSTTSDQQASQCPMPLQLAEDNIQRRQLMVHHPGCGLYIMPAGAKYHLRVLKDLGIDTSLGSCHHFCMCEHAPAKRSYRQIDETNSDKNPCPDEGCSLRAVYAESNCEIIHPPHEDPKEPVTFPQPNSPSSQLEPAEERRQQPPPLTPPPSNKAPENKNLVRRPFQSRPVKCLKCESSFGSLIGLKHHRTWLHLGRYFRCKQCGKTFGSQTALDKHFKKHEVADD